MSRENNKIELTWIDASMRSSGFWMHSSQRFSLDPVLEFPCELALLPEAPADEAPPAASDVKFAKAGEADLVTPVLVTTPSGPAKRKDTCNSIAKLNTEVYATLRRGVEAHYCVTQENKQQRRERKRQEQDLMSPFAFYVRTTT